MWHPIIAGFINVNEGAYATTATFNPTESIGTLTGTELISGEKVKLKNGKLQLDFEIPWQVKVIKLEL